MKVTGEAFSFILKRKRAEGARYTKSIQTFRQKDCYLTELLDCKTGTFFFCIPAFYTRKKVK
jgi:hypothetical protein